MKMWHVSNAGVILEIGGTKIGIDLFTEEHIMPYMYHDLCNILDESGKKSLDTLKILAYTHHHPDHFSREKTKQFLELHPNVIVWEAGDLSTVDTEYTLYRDIGIQKIPSPHMGKEANDMKHYSYLISYKGTNLLITGDARPDGKFYAQTKKYADKLHILIAPFPVLGLKSARKSLSEHFLPQKIFLLHFPSPEKDEGKWIQNTKKVCQTSYDGLADPIFCTRLGKQYSMY